MSDRIESRIIELESRLAQQERELEQLNEVLVYHGLMFDRLTELLRSLAQTWSGGSEGTSGSSEPPPPHY